MPSIPYASSPAADDNIPIEVLPVRPVHRRDYLLLIAFCLLLFGYEMFSGRPLEFA